jgi:signal transduction histidine kinase
MRQLVANMTHDLKTPLTSITGFSQAIAEGLPESQEEYRRLGQVINDEAGHMGALVDDLLYLSRIDSGELALTLEAVNIDELAEATAQRLAFQAESNGVSLRRALFGGSVRADGRRLEQVLTNLLENAIRFAPRGTEVLVRSYRFGAYAAIEVHNGGDPIPTDSLPHVFDRFFQGDPSRRRGHQGLGLAIVQELVQAHGGGLGAVRREQHRLHRPATHRRSAPRPEARRGSGGRCGDHRAQARHRGRQWQLSLWAGLESIEPACERVRSKPVASRRSASRGRGSQPRVRPPQASGAQPAVARCLCTDPVEPLDDALPDRRDIATAAGGEPIGSGVDHPHPSQQVLAHQDARSRSASARSPSRIDNEASAASAFHWCTSPCTRTARSSSCAAARRSRTRCVFCLLRAAGQFFHDRAMNAWSQRAFSAPVGSPLPANQTARRA